ncbi:SURF1 family protein [Sulfurirhabdus autotrophica]|uniref:SURF1-like protein n=1 Tax=Sulfurirhabdus autotrophica TaxID=1706046 RepID=A0A4R3XZF1_9PROT|nr:SURF1 family protein [Sulfurirhabdus autotrophica]TCV84756.1 surfeit locus 1 family protein [Sulfurirhabdus autotrophica]
MQISDYRFRPKLIPTIATLIVLPILINLGMWQAGKAEKKQALQTMYDQRGKGPVIQIGSQPLDPDTIRFSKVIARGNYEPAYQILLDNQIYQGRAGYQVITPLRIEGSGMHVLVYRGWVPTGNDRRDLPQIKTPQGIVEVTGYAHIPSNKFFELEQPENSITGWQNVWQNLDMGRYEKAVSFAVQPIAILMETSKPESSYVQDWPRPDARIGVNRGYAIQWYAMSVALVVIYLVTNIKKLSQEEKNESAN